MGYQADSSGHQVFVASYALILLSHPFSFEWAEFDAKLEHIASTDLLQSVISEYLPSA